MHSDENVAGANELCLRVQTRKFGLLQDLTCISTPHKYVSIPSEMTHENAQAKVFLWDIFF